MKAMVVLILILMVLAAATAIAYARTDVVIGVATMTTRAARPGEPISLLLSGSTLIAVARALRRRSV